MIGKYPALMPTGEIKYRYLSLELDKERKQMANDLNKSEPTKGLKKLRNTPQAELLLCQNCNFKRYGRCTCMRKDYIGSRSPDAS